MFQLVVSTFVSSGTVCLLVAQFRFSPEIVCPEFNSFRP